MAKNFINPQILECDIENTEHNFGKGSGSNGQGDWDIHCEYCQHNTGSHSEVRITGHHNGQHQGDVLKLTCVMKNGFRIKEVRETSGIPVSNVTENGFTLTRYNHFNPNENVGFLIQLVVYNGHNLNDKTGKGCVGAVGITGQPRVCDVVCLNVEER